MRCMAQVCSRCFGWGMPTTAMIPYADNLNHSDKFIVNETIHKRLHLLGDKNEGTYFQRDKFMSDYSAIYGGD